MAATRTAVCPQPNDDLTYQKFWVRLSTEEKAIIMKSMMPDWSDRRVASLCNVDERTLRRMDRYRQLKTLLESRPLSGGKFQGRLRSPIRETRHSEGFSNPDHSLR